VHSRITFYVYAKNGQVNGGRPSPSPESATGLDNWYQQSEKRKGQDKVDGIKQELYFESKEMHNEIYDLCFTYNMTVQRLL